MSIGAGWYWIIVLFAFIYLGASCAFLTYHIIKDGLGITPKKE